MWYLLAVVPLFFLCIFVSALLWGRRLKTSPRILLLHSLQSNYLDVSGLSLERFEQLLKMIDSAGFSCATPADCLHNRTKIAITFDDAYDDLMLLVPLLQRRRVPITVFVPTAYIGKSNDWDNFLARGRRRHLSEAQIRELVGLGVQFGSHGHTHRDLTTLNGAAVQKELELSRRILAELTSGPVVDLAYPFGRSNQVVRQLAARLGFLHQYASTPHTNHDPLIGRFPISKLDNALSLSGKLQGGFLAGIEALKSHVISRFSHLTPALRIGPPTA